MITPKKLKNLIKKEATIYHRYGEIKLKKENGYYYDVDDCLMLMKEMNNEEDKVEYAWECGFLFETKEDAEWELEFGNITRTESLSLPTWEEFITNDKYNYYGSSYFSFDNYRLIVKLPSEDDDCEFIGIDVDGNTEIYDWEEATKENYIEACKLCKKLFLGEEV